MAKGKEDITKEGPVQSHALNLERWDCEPLLETSPIVVGVWREICCWMWLEESFFVFNENRDKQRCFASLFSVGP